jgi:hypothetical protein
MKSHIFALAMTLFFTAKLCAQNIPAIEVSVFAGVPIQDVVQSNICCLASAFSSQQIEKPKYVAGASWSVLLTDRWRVEFGASYMPFSYRTTITTCCPMAHPVFTTHGTAWEFPALVTYRWTHWSVRPFSGGGFVVHNPTSGGANQSPAPVLRGGVEWARERWTFRPEFRYIHYPDASSSTDQRIGRPPTQMQVLLGLSVRVW